MRSPRRIAKSCCADTIYGEIPSHPVHSSFYLNIKTNKQTTTTKNLRAFFWQVSFFVPTRAYLSKWIRPLSRSSTYAEPSSTLPSIVIQLGLCCSHSREDSGLLSTQPSSDVRACQLLKHSIFHKIPMQKYFCFASLGEAKTEKNIQEREVLTGEEIVMGWQPK